MFASLPSRARYTTNVAVQLQRIGEKKVTEISAARPAENASRHSTEQARYGAKRNRRFLNATRKRYNKKNLYTTTQTAARIVANIAYVPQPLQTASFSTRVANKEFFFFLGKASRARSRGMSKLRCRHHRRGRLGSRVSFSVRREVNERWRRRNYYAD